MDNPYWDAVKDEVTTSMFTWDDTKQINRWNLRGSRMRGSFELHLDREEYVHRYSWSVPDPAAIAFVAVHSQADGLVDPMAGTGYWAYVLQQAGVDCVCYDRETSEENPWHPTGRHFVEVEKLPCAQSVKKHSDRVLFLSWPPYNEAAGEEAIRNYGGWKVIFLGEHDGCTGSEGMFELLDKEWTEVARHPLVQWEGLHDNIHVYERQAPLSW
jgi:hypothetical protein